MGWVRFFLGESRSRLYPHMRAKFGRDPTAGSKKVSFKFISRLGVRSLANASRARQFNPLNPLGWGGYRFLKQIWQPWSVMRGRARSCAVVRGRARSCAVVRGRGCLVVRSVAKDF